MFGGKRHHYDTALGAYQSLPHILFAACCPCAALLPCPVLSPEQAAAELIEAAANPTHPFAFELRQIAAWAKHAGWRKAEVGNGIVSLAENYKLAVEANRETERYIRQAWREPN